MTELINFQGIWSFILIFIIIIIIGIIVLWIITFIYKIILIIEEYSKNKIKLKFELDRLKLNSEIKKDKLKFLIDYNLINKEELNSYIIEELDDLEK